MLGRVFDQDRAALAVGDEMQPHRRVGDTEFLRDDVTLEIAAFLAAVFLRPRHSDPALGADAPAERGALAFAVPDLGGIEGAGRDLLGDERAHLAAQRFALGRQADLVETQFGAHGLPLARGDQRPEFVGAARDDQIAERDRPMALVAEIVAP